MNIEQYRVYLRVEEDKDPLLKSPARGALMHGVLLNGIAASRPSELSSDENVLSALHGRSGQRPYSQNLIRLDEGAYLWTINILHSHGGAAIKNWLEEIPASLILEHYQCTLSVCSVELFQETSYEQLLLQALSELPPKYVSFEFLTPLIFKKSGVRAPWPYPEARMILQSVLGRWSHFSDAAIFDDAQIFEDVSQYVSPHFLRIHSQSVAMDGVMFAGTTGSASFNIQKNELRQLMHLAGLYSEYCGIGAKTAMGLGAVRYQPALVSRNTKASSRAHFEQEDLSANELSSRKPD